MTPTISIQWQIPFGLESSCSSNMLVVTLNPVIFPSCWKIRVEREQEESENNNLTVHENITSTL